MKSIFAQRRGGLHLNMTPLIDVVFQLIIFFLAAAHLARVETQQQVDLPAAESGQNEPQARGRRVVVTVLADGTATLGGRPIDPAAVGNLLRDQREADPEGEVELRIRADRGAPYRAVEPLLLESARSGVWKVTFAVLPAT